MEKATQDFITSAKMASYLPFLNPMGYIHESDGSILEYQPISNIQKMRGIPFRVLYLILNRIDEFGIISV